jgi:hypothetical protein
MYSTHHSTKGTSGTRVPWYVRSSRVRTHMLYALRDTLLVQLPIGRRMTGVGSHVFVRTMVRLCVYCTNTTLSQKRLDVQALSQVQRGNSWALSAVRTYTTCTYVRTNGTMVPWYRTVVPHGTFGTTTSTHMVELTCYSCYLCHVADRYEPVRDPTPSSVSSIIK